MSKALTKQQLAAMLTAADEGFADEQKAMLSADLSRANVKTRQQAGRELSYVEGWWAIAEANRIFGFDGWSSETVHIAAVAEGSRNLGKPPNSYAGFGVSYIARVRVTVYAGSRVLIREGVGTGHGIDRDLGQAHESAIKEAETDARKRALMTFGNPFGLALYDKQQRNVSDGDDEAPAPQKAAKPAKAAPQKAPETADAGPPVTAETLLEGTDHHQGMRVIVAYLKNAASHVKAGTPLPDALAVKTLNEAYANWDHWRSQCYPRMSKGDRSFVAKWLSAHYEPAAKSLDTALAAGPGLPAHDPETGELTEDAA